MPVKTYAPPKIVLPNNKSDEQNGVGNIKKDVWNLCLFVFKKKIKTSKQSFNPFKDLFKSLH